MKSNRLILATVAIALPALLLSRPWQAVAQCDALDGPVVKAAQQALAERSIGLALIWVPREAEGEVKRAFDKTLSVRQLGVQARELADQYFFETLVRLHCAGEGMPFAGLKPAGRDLGPAIPAGVKALETGDIKPLRGLLS